MGKLSDGGGLFRDVRANGSRYWRMKYRHAGKERLLSFGVYPDVALAEARRRRDAARELIHALALRLHCDGQAVWGRLRDWRDVVQPHPFG